MADDGGLSSFQRRMQAIPKAAREAVAPALVKQAELMADTMRTLAPKKTGKLADSIAVTGPAQATPPYSQPGGSLVTGSNQAAVTAGSTDVRYAHLVEYGHSNGLHGSIVPPHPFFWPSVRLNQKKAQKAIKREIRKAIRGAR